MRALPIAVTVFAAALALTSCDSGGSGDSGKSGDPAGSGSATKAAVAACVIGDAGVQVGPANAATAAGDTGNVPVTLTNKGGRCVLKGVPRVSVKAAAGGSGAEIGAEGSAPSEELTLAKGDTASFTITYVRGADGDANSLAAKTLTIGFPGGGATRDFPWSYGAVAGKGSAEVLEASVSAFQHAGD
ncbi:DUF4232 domain-containing protein [Streptomyces sp. NPDC007084]|uniref:DUF4232 domain-containing protein n=1 Tax=Streptomyces sp. NPDC007084 TaxID=3154313 RepID=UPI003454B859